MSEIADALRKDGWAMLPRSDVLSDWVRHVHPTARMIAEDADQKAVWLRHGETWFAGVNVLPNDVKGRVGDGREIPAYIIQLIAGLGMPTELDAAQISVVYPGYPKQDADETDQAHRFRKIRDAAHLDGLLPVGVDRRRHLHEPHAYVLGIPLTKTSTDASPMVVWRGSHLMVQKNFMVALGQLPPDQWQDVDLTEIYHETRYKTFMECERVEVHAQPGSAYLVHRLAIHGVAPWGAEATAPLEGRMIAYFRPELSKIADWLSL